MSQMFDQCLELIELDLSSFDTSNVTNMSSMFSYCTKLASLDLSNFDTSNVTNMSRMFEGCSSLNYIKCTQAFKNWCLENQSTIYLPNTMKEDGNGIWKIVG